MSETQTKVVLITGAAKRIGATLASYLHARDCNIVIHYGRSQAEAEQLKQQLNQVRANSCITLQADLADTAQLPKLVEQAHSQWGRLDVLINNASTFYPTPLQQASETHWQDLMASNLKAPYFLSQHAEKYLAKHEGCIINITDIHASQPLAEHSIYCMAKAGLVMQTQALAKELAPKIRVNAIAPGAIIWPEGSTAEQQANRLKDIPLARLGKPEDIAATAWFLIQQSYMTGTILPVDGGRRL